MILKDSFTIHAPVEVVWDYLNDIPQVSTCTPGIERVEEIEADVYQGTLKVKVGPVSAAFTGKVSIIERLAPQRFVARIEGNDRSSASTVSATFTALLAPVEEDTQITYTMDMALRGRLAQFGLAVVQGTAKKMTAEFVECLQEALSQTRRILVLGADFSEPDIEAQELSEFDIALVMGSAENPEELVQQASKADIILTDPQIEFSPAVLRQLKNTRAIVCYGADTNNIHTSTATQQGIMVVNVPDYCIEEVATHTMALILAMTRKLLAGHQVVAAGKWSIQSLRPTFSSENQVLGLVGYGKVGRAVQRKAKPFGFEVIVHEPLEPGEQIRVEGARPVSLAELLSQADVVSLHTPLTSKSFHMIDGRALEGMKKTAFLVNTSRGGLVDMVALKEAVQEGRVAGAALDIPDYESAESDRPLLESGRFLITPHIACYSEGSLERLRRLASSEVARMLKGELPLNLVNREVVTENDMESVPGPSPIRWSE